MTQQGSRRLRRLADAALIAGCVVGLSGCASLNDAPEPTLPPDAVQIRVYTDGGRGGDGQPESVRWLFESTTFAGQWGVVTPIPEATCISLGSQWTLSIDEGGRNLPIDRSRHTQFSGASPLELSIERDAAGRITVTEGVPDWMEGKPPLGCAALR